MEKSHFILTALHYSLFYNTTREKWGKNVEAVAYHSARTVHITHVIGKVTKAG